MTTSKKSEISNVLFYLCLFLVGISLAVGFFHWAIISGPTSAGHEWSTFTENPTPTPSPSPTPTPTISQPLKVLSIAYYPLRDGRLDTVGVIKDTYNEYNFSLAGIRSKVKSLERETKKALEEGSAYTPYGASPAQPYIDYQIIDHQEVLESFPLMHKLGSDSTITDYQEVARRFNFCDWVDTKGVREIWLWGYAGTGRNGWTSNFSSKYGDISNSNRDPTDLPLCQHSYTVYDYNYGRGVAEAVMDHTFQYEALFGYLNYELFGQQFTGRDQLVPPHWDPSAPVKKVVECGWTNTPPNTDKVWDYANSQKVITHCADWTVYQLDPQSDGKEINCTIWGCNSLGYLKWWMQQLPGYQNGLSYRGKKLRNWWEFVVDFDEAMQKGTDLVER